MIEKAVGVYFIDQYNFASLCESAVKGDELATDLVQALAQFVDDAPPPVCAMCKCQVPVLEIPNMVITIMRIEGAMLISWICEECSTRDDLDTQIEKVLRDWPIVPKDSVIEFIKKGTIH